MGDADRRVKQSPFRPRCCAAAGCAEAIRPTQLFCGQCWSLVPMRARAELADAFRSGTPASAQATPDWLAAVQAAIEAVSFSKKSGFVDGRPVPEELTEQDGQQPAGPGRSSD